MTVSEMLKSWFYPTIQELYPVNIDALEFRASRPLDCTVFKTEISATTTPIIELVHGGVFALIGDARRSPYYVTGHGINHAIQGAQAFIEGMHAVYDQRPFIQAMEKFDRELKGPEVELSAEAKKLMIALERLIKHLTELKIKEIPQASIQMLTMAKHKIVGMEFDEIELALKEISPIIQKQARKHTELGYACWRGLKQLFNTKANASMMLLEKTEEHLARAKRSP